MVRAAVRLVEALEALVVVGVFATGVSDKVMTDVGLGQVVMALALATVMAWAAVMSGSLRRLMGLMGLMLRAAGGG